MDEPDEDAPGYQDAFEREVAEADQARIQAQQQGPVNDVPGPREVAPQPYLADAPVAGHYDPDAGFMEDTPEPVRPAPQAADPMGPPSPVGGPFSAGDPSLDGDAAPGQGRTAPPARDRYAALNDYEAALRQQPVMKKPNWMERIGAAALGGAAGWTNAAGRIKHPIDIGAATEGILHPGYSQDLEAWRSRVAPLQAAAQLEGQRNTADLAYAKEQRELDIANRKETSETALRQSQAEAAKQHGAYWQSRSEQERNQWKIDPKTGSLYNTVTHQVIDRAKTPEDRYKDAMALDPNTPPDQARYYALNGSMSGYGSTLANTPAKMAPTATEAAAYMAAGIDPVNPPPPGDPRWAKVHENLKPPKPADPLANELREQRLVEGKNKDLDGLGARKDQVENQIQNQRRNEVAATLQRMGLGSEQDALATPNGKAAIIAINRKYAPALQNNQDNYASAAQRRGIDTKPYEVVVNPDTLESTLKYPPVAGPSAVPAPPAGPGRGAPPPAQAAPPAAAEAPVRRYNAHGDAVEWNGQQWLPVPRQ